MFHANVVDAGSATSSEASFWNNWGRVKNSLFDLINLPSNFDKLASRAAQLKGFSRKIGRSDLASRADEHVQWANANEKLKFTVKDKLAKNLASWKKKASEPKNTFGAISIFLGTAALLALGYIASKGMDLLSEYQTRKRALDLLEREVISAGEAQGLIESSKGGTIASTLKRGIVKTGLGIALPIMGLVGGLIAAKMIWSAYVGSKLAPAKRVYGKAKDVWGVLKS